MNSNLYYLLKIQSHHPLDDFLFFFLPQLNPQIIYCYDNSIKKVIIK